MLYEAHEIQRAALEPLRWWAQANVNTFGNPFSPLAYAPEANKLVAGFDLMLRLTKRYVRPEFGIDSVVVDGKATTVQEEVLLDNPFCSLLHFQKSRRTKNEPAVLIFAPLSGHFSTLLRDTVRTLLSDHDVTITDWKDAREVSLAAGPFHFDDYVAYVQEFIRFMRARSGGKIHVISVCQPTVPVLAGVSLMASRGEAVPNSLTMMGGPIDTRLNPTSVNDFAVRKPLSWFEQHVIQRVPIKYPGGLRRVYPGFMQLSGFIAMNPERHMESHRDYYSHLVEGDGDSAEAHRRFYDEYLAVMDLPAEYYLDTIVRVFHEQSIARGLLEVAGDKVNPADIRKAALFTIEGELDDISGSGQTKAAHTLCTGIPAARRQHYTAPAVGHYGIFSGRKFRETIYPKIRSFIAQHN